MKIIIYFFRNNICNYGVQKENLSQEASDLQKKGRTREKSDKKGQERNVCQESENSGEQVDRDKSG